MIGKTLRNYRIVEKLGAGGQGTVYKATDAKLGRTIVIKVLPPELTAKQTSLKRFEREARLASSLDHPNICTIFDLDEVEGLHFIAMQYVEGRNVRQLLQGRPLELRSALLIALQVVDALVAAHARGIIHRDIKPGNVMVTPSGQVKILDFGLAKLVDEAQAGELEIHRTELTEVGVPYGTATYAAPEQARGDHVDKRADIFSTGVLLYEMLTGSWPFRGMTTVDVRHAVIHDSPKPLAEVQPGLPAQLQLILDRALAKDPTDRYQRIDDFRAELLNVLHEIPAVERSEQASLIFAQEPPRRLARESSAEYIVSEIKLHGRAVGATLALIVIVTSAGLFFYFNRATALTAKDTIVLADFDNKTGDPVFDETLKQALAVDLGQSPFLNILSDRKMASTLSLMGRPPDQPVIGEVARELCQRVGSKAMLAGSISSLGNEYVVGMQAINCSNGEMLVVEQARASGKADVLRALDSSASALRTKLGESLASVEKSDIPLVEATTASLEALKAFSVGRKLMFQKGESAALPYLQRAVELDPNFALAYRYMAVAYANLAQSTRASENANRAFQLRGRVSERERYAIEAFYYSYTTGELEKANEVYELWKHSYSRDYLPFGNLGDNYMKFGQWEKALPETQEALRLAPDVAMYNSNLAWVQLALNRTDEAKRTVEQALLHNMDTEFLRLALYEIGFLKGQEETRQRQLAWGAGRPSEEAWLLSAQSDTEAYFGRLVKAQEFSQHAIDSSLHADAKETAALWQINVALREAEVGKADSSRHDAAAALALMPGKDIRSVAALTLSSAGDVEEGKRLADGLKRDFPQDTVVQGYWLPSIRAAIELNAQNSAKAIEILQTAAPYELGQCEPFQLGMLYPIYLRGQAHLLAHQGKEAAAEFQRIIDHRGIVLNHPLGALALVGLGRAYTLQGDTTKARAFYEDFLTLWKNADPDIPILKQAKAEYAKL